MNPTTMDPIVEKYGAWLVMNKSCANGHLGESREKTNHHLSFFSPIPKIMDFWGGEGTTSQQSKQAKKFQNWRETTFCPSLKPFHLAII